MKLLRSRFGRRIAAGIALVAATAADNPASPSDASGEIRVTSNADHTAWHFGAAQLLHLPVHEIATKFASHIVSLTING